MLRQTRARRLLVAAAAALALVWLGAGCGEDDVEESLGDMSVASIEAAYAVDRDPLINDWLNTTGQTIVSHSKRQHIPYEFKVIETELVNAFAAPYGHIYVTSGFLDFTETEDEVATVVAHEVGHVVHRHSIHSFKKSLLWGLVTQIISGKSETAGDIVGIGLGLLSLQYSRDNEYEADDAGTRLAYRAGYDPHVGLNFFHRLATDLEGRRPSRWEVYFMTHPPTDARIKRQLGNDELDESNAEAIARIARGYLLRGQPARAARLLEAPAVSSARIPEFEALLGDAWYMRGNPEQASGHYQAALSMQGDSRYVGTRLAALQQMPPNDLAGVGAAGQAAAAALMPQVAEARTLADRTASGTQRYVASSTPQLSSLGSTVKGINDQLYRLAETEANVSDTTKNLIIHGNAAVSKATESVYVLERVNEELAQCGSDIKSLLGECEVALAAAQQGRGNPEDVAALGASVDELKLGLVTLDGAMQQVPGTISTVQSAQSAAEEVTSLMDLIARRDDPKSMLGDQLRSASAHAQRVGTEALAAVNRAREQSVEARGHALVARLNLLGTAATPSLQATYDRQLSYLLLVPEAQVRSMRAAGAGYGEAAMAIAAGRSLDVNPARFLPPTSGGVSPISAAMQQGASVGNADVLLKFLAASMQAERDAAMAAM